jgi:serine protease Do
MSAMSRRQFAVFAAVLAVAPALARPALARPDSFAPVVRRVLPSVVAIGVTETVGGPDPLADLPPEIRRQLRNRLRRNEQQVQGAGSGFIVDPAGYIVTNNHVVGSADRITVSLTDGTELPAKLIGVDELTDIAVIKVDPPHPLPAVQWGDSDAMEVGDWVIAAGNPFGLGGSVTVGIFSARGRDIGASAFDDYIQTDASINPGNSGGPLFNADGQVIGVNSAIISPNGSGSVGIGFAVPSNVAARIAAELRAHGRVERGWLGVSVADVTTPDGQRRRAPGVVIASVDRNGPAARAGMRPGDVVTALNGQQVDSSRDLIRSVAAVTPGGSMNVTVRRQGREIEVPVTVGRRPANDPG